MLITWLQKGDDWHKKNWIHFCIFTRCSGIESNQTKWWATEKWAATTAKDKARHITHYPRRLKSSPSRYTMWLENAPRSLKRKTRKESQLAVHETSYVQPNQGKENSLFAMQSLFCSPRLSPLLHEGQKQKQRSPQLLQSPLSSMQETNSRNSFLVSLKLGKPTRLPRNKAEACSLFPHYWKCCIKS